MCSGLPPYHDVAHDAHLASKICQGLRPNLHYVKAPQLLKDLISKCLDAEPSNRPRASELSKILAKTEQKKRNDLKIALKLAFETSEELEEIIATNQLLISEEMKELLKSKLIEVKRLKSRVNELEVKGDNNFQELTRKKSQLEEMKKTIIANNPDAKDNLEEFLEAQKTNNSILIEACRKRLNSQLAMEEINSLCRHQAEITQLAVQLEETNVQKSKQITQIINTTITIGGGINAQESIVVIGSNIGDNTNLNYAQAKETENKRRLSDDSQVKNSQERVKLFKAIETQVYQTEPMQIEENNN
ncbi:2676_t:CDS:2 [Entrophospora sp. SA101]|nr:2676_t:CDS:2 [Entrophospora sp. SA101]CAJ0833048.1 1063_t:CDS:2 [Entrophospora sp. SA101]